MATKTLALRGNAAGIIDVECSMTNGLPALIIVGFVNRAVTESRERLRSAFSNSGLPLPPKRITINLAPADLPKETPAYDLAMAVSVLEAQRLIPKLAPRTMFFGELGLQGDLKAVRGIIGLLVAAEKLGFQTFYVPSANLRQALVVPSLVIIAVENLDQIYQDLSGQRPLPRQNSGQTLLRTTAAARQTDFQHVIGQTRAKRALAVAAAGRHNVLLSGAPGTGKSMLAKTLPSIMPPLTDAEILEVSHLHSLSGMRFDKLVTERPFRDPHHSVSTGALLGGGSSPQPGEISLAHSGVLFLDELPEFKPGSLEALRQPLEDHQITIARSHDSVTFPADFILVATANPCPCGNLGSEKKCTCLAYDLLKYQRRISGPLWDRIDLYVEVESIQHERLLSDGSEESSTVIARRVEQAQKRQRDRGQTSFNALLPNQEVKKYAVLSARQRRLLNDSARHMQLSARAYMRVLKVARTIADLESSSRIQEHHLTEALQYRKRENHE